MRTRTLAALALATVVAGACSSPPADPEVLGVVVERSDGTSVEPDAPVPEATSGPAVVREAPAVGARGLATLTAEAEPDDPDPPPPVRAPATTAPSPEPSAEAASAAPVPAQLAEGPGSTYTWSQPPDPPEEGTWWWVEASSLPTQDAEADPWNGARVAAIDIESSEGEDMTTEPVRRATCEAWIEAPVDRGVRGSGTVTVTLEVNGDAVATGSSTFDGELAPGERHRVDRVGSARVDARAGDSVTCRVRFETDR